VHRDAAVVLRAKSLHQELVGKAAAVLVFPHHEAGLGVGGLHGEGALQVNGKIVKPKSLARWVTIGVAEHWR
jgi:hypothetical protein